MSLPLALGQIEPLMQLLIVMIAMTRKYIKMM